MTHLSPQSSKRAAILGHRGAVLWFTGLSGSGKSTLASTLEDALLTQGILAAVIDGDVLRRGLSRDLSFKPEDRHENIRRAGELAFALAESGLVVIVALISPFQSDRAAVAERAREKGLPFAEIFINAPLATCEQRDPKGLYRKARAGHITSFTGLDSPYEPPVSPALELRTHLDSIEQSVAKLTELALHLARPAARLMASSSLSERR